jgi:hypothetical protein
MPADLAVAGDAMVALVCAGRGARLTTQGAGGKVGTPEKRRIEEGVAKKWFESDIVKE